MSAVVLEEKGCYYRIKWNRGQPQERLFWVDSKGKVHGKQPHKRVTQSQSAHVDGTNPKKKMITTEHHAMEDHYPIGFSKDAAQQLVEAARTQVTDPKFYLVFRDKKYPVSADDFVNGDFKEIINRPRAEAV